MKPQHDELYDKTWVQALLLAAAVALCYGHTLHAPYYLDDISAIVNNPLLAEPARFWRQWLSPRFPVMATFALNYAFGGQAVAGYHLVNLAIHFASALLSLLLLRRVFRDDRLLPLLGALLFAVHPLQTQAVTYIVQRMTSLSALFFLLALYLFVRSRELLAAGAPLRTPPVVFLYGGALLSAVLAIWSKESAVVLPVALYLFVRSFLPADERRSLLRALVPLAAVALAFALIRFGLPLLGGTSLQQLTHADPYLAERNSPLRYLVTEFSVLWIYLRLLIVPYGQALDASYPVVTDLLTAQNLLAGGGLLVLGGLAWRLRRRRPRLAFAIAWFFLTLAVESSVIPLDPLFEHRLYLPLFGFAVACGDGLTLLAEPRRRLLLALPGLLVLIVLCWQRNALWNSPVLLGEDNLRQVPTSERVLINLAGAYLEAGRTAEAEAAFLHALEVNPGNPLAYRVVTRYFVDQGRIDQALQLLDRGVARQPRLAELCYLRAEVLLIRHDLDGALRDLRQALTLDPSHLAAAIDLSRTLRRAGRRAEAEDWFAQRLTADPGDPLAWIFRIATRNNPALPRLDDAAVLALGEKAVELGAWGEAKGALELLERIGSRRAVELSATLERARRAGGGS